MPQKITLYSTSWCGSCHTAKRFLADQNIAYNEIDIDLDDSSAQKVIDWSGGRRVVPTFHIECDEERETILHNPGLKELAEHVGAVI